MQEKNIKKMTEMADTTVNDVPTLNILLCCLLYKMEKPIEVEQLYDIVISTDMINFFDYQDSIEYLTTNGLISVKENSSGQKCYYLEPKGKECATQLKNYAPKTMRDNLLLSARKYISRRKNEQEVKIEYIPAEKGCYIQVSCLGKEFDFMELKLYAPDMTQAKLLGEKIMLNPARFYSRIIEFALSNEEPKYDLTDN